MAYRTAGMIDAGMEALGPEHARDPREVQRRIEEYAVECSILKVYGSEMLTLVADELIATMGGYGYVEEYPAERFYRDARINRIFEGTNEINRLIITGWLMKRAMSGKLPLLAAIKALMDEVMQPPSFDAAADTGEPLAREIEVLAAVKKIALFAAGVASQRFMTALQDQQEVMADLADMIMQVYAFESALAARAQAGRIRQGGARAEWPRPWWACWPRRAWRWPSRQPGACWRPAAKATCCVRNWPSFAASPAPRLQMRLP